MSAVLHAVAYAVASTALIVFGWRLLGTMARHRRQLRADVRVDEQKIFELMQSVNALRRVK